MISHVFGTAVLPIFVTTKRIGVVGAKKSGETAYLGNSIGATNGTKTSQNAPGVEGHWRIK